MGIFSKCFNSQITCGSDCINHLANLNFARSKRSSRKDCPTFPIFTNSHQILWLPANLVKDTHENKTANETSCCHCLLPGCHPNQLRQGSVPPPWLAVIGGWGWTMLPSSSTLPPIGASQPPLHCSPRKSHICRPAMTMDSSLRPILKSVV